MSFDLLAPILAYFEAGKVDGEALARCFTATAVVRDEGHTYDGVEEVKRWKTDVASKYAYVCEPFAFEPKDGKAVVTSRLTGNFPGSPVDLQFVFRLEGNQIASLEILP